MAVSIDERVVEMRFNNKQFEEGVKKSMKSLNDLDQSIDKLDNNGLDNLMAKLNNVNFDAIEKSLGSLEKRFSTFGVMGMTVIQDLTHGIETMVASIGKLFMKPFAQIKSGGWKRALNIENAKFQLSGLKVAWDKVSDDINYAVSGTAFGLDAAAKAASQLVASGVEFGKTFGPTGNSPMAKALRGISGVAAMSNSAYEEISPIFTTIAGQGKVMTMQLRQLESRGLNAAAELGKALGKTEKEIRQMVTDGKIDFETFANAMDNAFGEHAKEANKTFSGSMANMKAALSRIGADVATEVLEDMVGVFNSLREAIDYIHVLIKPTLQEINKWVSIITGSIQAFVTRIIKDGTLDKFILDLQDGVIGLSRAVSKFILNFINYGQPIRKNIKEIADILKDMFGRITGLNGEIHPLRFALNTINASLRLLLLLLNGITYAIKVVLQAIANSNNKELKALVGYLQPLAKIILPAIVAMLILSKLHLLKVAAVLGAISLAVAGIVKFDLINKAKALGDTIKNSIKDAIDSVKQSLDNLVGSLTTVKDKSNDAKKGLDKVNNAATSSGKAVDKSMSSITSNKTFSGLKRIGDMMTGVLGIYVNSGSKVFTVMKNLIESIVTGYTQLAPAAKMVVLLGSAIAIFLLRLPTMVKRITTAIHATSLVKTMDNVSRSLNGITMAALKLANGLKNYLFRLGLAAEIRSIALAVAVLAASVTALGIAATIMSNNIKNGWAFAGVIAALISVIAAFGGVLFLISKIKEKQYQIQAVGETIDDFTTAIGGALTRLAKGFAKSMQLRAIGSVIRSVALVIAAIAASVVIMYKAVPDRTVLMDLTGKLVLLAGIMAALGIAVSVIGGIQKDSWKDWLAFSGFMLGLSSALLILSQAIAMFKEITWDIKLVKGLVLLAGSIAVLVGVLFASSKLLAKISVEIGSFLVTVAGLAALLLVAPAVIDSIGVALQKIQESVKGLTAAERIHTGILVALIGTVSMALMLATNFAKFSLGAVVTLAATIIGIWKALEYLEKVGGDPEALEKIKLAWDNLMWVIGGIAVTIAGLFVATGFTQNLAKLAVLILSIPSALLMLAGAMKVMQIVIRSMISEGELDDVLLVMGGFLGIIAIAVSIGNLAKGSWAAIATMSLLVLSLAATLGLLSWLADEYGTATVLGVAAALLTGLIGVAAALGILGNVLEKMKIGVILTVAGAMTAVILALGGAMWLILQNERGWGEIAAAGIVLIAAIAVICKVISELDTVTRNTVLMRHGSTVIAVAFSLGLVMAAFGVAINLILARKSEWYEIATAGAMIIGALAVIVAALKMMETIGGSGMKGATALAMSGSIAIMAGSMLLIAGAIKELTDVPPGVILATVGAMGALMVVLATAAGILGSVPEVAGMAIAVLLVLGVTLMQVAASTWILSKAIQNLVAVKDDIAPTMKEFAKGLESVVIAISNSLSRFIVDGAKTVRKVLRQLVKAIGQILAEAAKQILKVTTQIIVGVNGRLAVGCSMIIDMIHDLIVGIGWAIGQGIRDLKAVAIEGKEIGNYVGFSLSMGMLESLQKVYDAAWLVGEAVEGGVRGSTTINSPGPKFIEIGSFVTKSIAMGLVGGIPGLLASIARSNLGDKVGTFIGKTCVTKIGDFFKTQFGPMVVKAADDPAKDAANEVVEDVAEEAGETANEAVEEQSEDVIQTFIDMLTSGDFSGAIEYAKQKGIDYAQAFGQSAFGEIGNMMEDFNQSFDLFAGEEGSWADTRQGIMNTRAWKLNYQKQVDYYTKLFKRTGSIQKRYKSLQGLYDDEEAMRLAKRATSLSEAKIQEIAEKKMWNIYTYNKRIHELIYAEYSDSTDALAKWLDEINGIIDEEDITPNTEEGADDVNQMSDALKGLRDSLSQAIDAFNGFDRTVKLTTKEMMKNVKNTVLGVDEWTNGIVLLAKRGLNADAIEKLISAGPQQSYQEVAVLLQMSSKELKKYNKQYVKTTKQAATATKAFAKMYTVDAEGAIKINKKALKAMYDPSAWKKDMQIGIMEAATLTGKQLKKALKAKLDSINLGKLLAGDGSLTKALSKYLDSSTSKSKDATKAFNDYVTKAYLASLSETERQEALALSNEKLAKKVQKWWKEQEESVRESIHSQIRSMAELDKAYSQTGEELMKDYKQQNKDAKQATVNRLWASGLMYAKGLKKAGEYMEDLADDKLLSFRQGYERAFAEEGQAGADAYVESFAKAITAQSTEDKIYSLQTQFDVLKDSGNMEGMSAYVESLGKMASHIKEPMELFEDAKAGIAKGLVDLVKTDKVFTRMTDSLQGAFNFVDADGSIKAIDNYILSLVDFDEVLEEVSVTGVDVADVIKEHMDEAADAMKKWQETVQSSLVSTLQSFDEFDAGEKKSLSNMIKNLQGNITKLNEWRANIKKMQELGYSQSLIDYMASQGINSYQEVAALTGDVAQYQIDEINQMWEQVADDSEKAADEALGAVALSAETVGRDTVDGIISSITTNYSDSEEELSTGITTVTEEAVSEGLTNVDVTEPAKSFTSNLSTMISKFLLDPSGTISGLPAAVKTYASTFLGNTVDASISSAGNKSKKKAKKKGKEVGENLGQGIINGIKGKQEAINKAVDKVCDTIVGIPMKKLGIHSPSTVFQWMGEMTAEGFAIGFGNNTYAVENEVDDFTAAILAYAQRLADDLDSAMPAEDDFTIKPVLDLDNLQNANSQIQSLLGNGDIAVRSNMLAGSISTNSDWSMLSKALSGMGGNSTTNTYGDIQITVNAPEGADANEIANAVMAKIQQSVDRRKYV